MRGTLRLITPPTAAPIMIDLARQHLRQDQVEDDAIIALQLQAAVESVEAETGRVLVPQTWEYRLDGTTCDRPQLVTGDRIRLPLAPLLSVESVVADGVTLAVDEYEMIAPAGPTCGRGEVRFLGGSWGPAWRSVVITFRAGYETVPFALKAAVLLALGSLYDNRAAEAETGGGSARSLSANPAYQRLIRPYQLIG